MGLEKERKNQMGNVRSALVTSKGSAEWVVSKIRDFEKGT